MTDNGGNDRRRKIEGRINTLGAGGNSVSGRGNRGGHGSRDASVDTETDGEGVSSGLGDDDTADASTGADGDADTTDASSAGAEAEAITEEDDSAENEAETDDSDDGSDADADDESESDDDDGSDADGDDESESEGDDEPLETREEDVDSRSSLEVEMDRFVRAFAARRADNIGEDSLDEYIVGSVKGYLAGLLGGDVESPGTLEREVEIEADDVFGGLLDTVAEDDQERGDVVIAAIAEAYDVPEDDSLVVAGLRDHEALLNGVVANSSNDLDDVSEVVQAAVETRLIEERAD